MNTEGLNFATQDYIRRHIHEDVRQLALHPVPADVDLRTALIQIEGRQLAAHKLPTWVATDGLLFPPRLALEQCSSEATAHYKRSIIQRRLQLTPPSTFIDLTAGLGVDFTTLATLFDRAVYVEQQPELCELAVHNFPLLGLTNTEVRCSKAEENLQMHVDVVLIDPARRDAAGRKVARLEDCTPDVCQLLKALRAMAPIILIKLSPMLDLAEALRSLQGVVEAHVVSVDGECKELLLVVQGTETAASKDFTQLPPTNKIPVYCVDIPFSERLSSSTVGNEKTSTLIDSCKLLQFTRSDEAATPMKLADKLGEYLYEPHASILKAGAYKSVCKFYPVTKLAINTHLYTSLQLVENFPGRTWRILDKATFAKRELKRLLQNTPAADLTVRGFPVSTNTLRKQLHLHEGGQTHLIATTFSDQRLLLRVERV